MLIAIFGESCSGKTTLANKLKERLNARVFSGKDYLRLAKNEEEAKKQFKQLLNLSLTGENVIYVIAQKEHLEFIPKGAVRVLVTAPLDVIKQRFAKRTGGILPPPISKMLENNHGCFDNEPHDYHLCEKANAEQIIEDIIAKKA